MKMLSNVKLVIVNVLSVLIIAQTVFNVLTIITDKIILIVVVNQDSIRILIELVNLVYQTV